MSPFSAICFRHHEQHVGLEASYPFIEFCPVLIDGGAVRNLQFSVSIWLKHCILLLHYNKLNTSAWIVLGSLHKTAGRFFLNSTSYHVLNSYFITTVHMYNHIVKICSYG